MDLASLTGGGEAGTRAGAIPIAIPGVLCCPRHSLMPLFQLVLQSDVLTATCESICALQRAEASAITPLQRAETSAITPRHTGVQAPVGSRTGI